MSLLPVRPRHDFLFVDIIDRNVTKKDLGDGKVLHLLSDDDFGPDRPHDPTQARHPGLRPRWARVLMVGPEAEGDVEPGDLVLCDALKWSHGITLGRYGLAIVQFWRINVNDILLVEDDDDSGMPRTDTIDYLNQFAAMMEQVEITLGHL